MVALLCPVSPRVICPATAHEAPAVDCSKCGNPSHHVFMPHPALRQYIECYWVERRSTHSDIPSSLRVLPDGRFNLAFKVFALPKDVSNSCASRNQCWLKLIGTRTRYKDISVHHNVQTFVVRFKPGAVYSFIGVPAKELVDHAVDLKELWGDEARRLHEDLVGSSEPQTQALLVEQTLLRQLPRAASLDHVALATVRQITNTAGRTSIGGLAAAMGVSDRQLRNKFARWVGLSPKRFARIIRFRAFMQMASTARAKDWVRLAQEAGYCDQPHLIHDFHEFTGASPVTMFSGV